MIIGSLWPGTDPAEDPELRWGRAQVQSDGDRRRQTCPDEKGPRFSCRRRNRGGTKPSRIASIAHQGRGGATCPVVTREPASQAQLRPTNLRATQTVGTEGQA